MDKKLMGAFKGPKDLAENHDQYLGQPRKRVMLNRILTTRGFKNITKDFGFGKGNASWTKGDLKVSRLGDHIRLYNKGILVGVMLKSAVNNLWVVLNRLDPTTHYPEKEIRVMLYNRNTEQMGHSNLAQFLNATENDWNLFKKIADRLDGGVLLYKYNIQMENADVEVEAIGCYEQFTPMNIWAAFVEPTSTDSTILPHILVDRVVITDPLSMMFRECKEELTTEEADFLEHLLTQYDNRGYHPGWRITRAQWKHIAEINVVIEDYQQNWTKYIVDFGLDKTKGYFQDYLNELSAYGFSKYEATKGQYPDGTQIHWD